jgi:hypothetical protein
VIDFGKVGHAEAFEDVQRLAAVLRVVEDDVDDRAAERHAPAEVVDEGVVQALLVAHPSREGREGRIGALVAFRSAPPNERSSRWASTGCPAITAVQNSTLKIICSNVARNVRCPTSNG